MWTVNGHVAGENLIWAILGLIVAFFYMPRIIEGLEEKPFWQNDAVMLQAGIALVATGGVLHRMWWAVWRWTGKPDWMEDVSLIVTTPAVGMIAFGYTLHILVAKGISRIVLATLGGFIAFLYILGQVIAH